MASLYDAILDAVRTTVNNLALTYGIDLVPVVKVKEPKARESIDTLPAILVSPAPGEFRVRFATEGMWQATLPVQVSVVHKGNLDLQTDQAAFLDWRERIQAALDNPPIGGLTCVMAIEPDPSAAYDRSVIPQGLDFSAMVFKFICLENR